MGDVHRFQGRHQSRCGEVSDPNERPGARAQNVLQYLATSLVDEPDSVEITSSQWRTRVSLSLSVAPDDMGKVIGRKGRTAQAMRAVVRAVGALDQHDVYVDIVD
jgi:uncharacterized protein